MTDSGTLIIGLNDNTNNDPDVGHREMVRTAVAR